MKYVTLSEILDGFYVEEKTRWWSFVHLHAGPFSRQTCCFDIDLPSSYVHIVVGSTCVRRNTKVHFYKNIMTVIYNENYWKMQIIKIKQWESSSKLLRRSFCKILVKVMAFLLEMSFSIISRPRMSLGNLAGTGQLNRCRETLSVF